MDSSRRDFFSFCSIVAMPLLPNQAMASLITTDKFIRSTCEMCPSRCPIQIRVINNQPTSITGNNFAPQMQKKLCARGVAGISQLDDPKRLKKPLIRVGKRGDGNWREASWDEALDLVAKNLLEIKAKYGAKSVIFSSKTGENYQILRSFSSHFGSPNIFSHYSSCPVAIEMAMEHTFGETLERDFENANYILNFGHNLFEGLDITQTSSLAKFCNTDGKRLVVLEPRFSVLASKASLWLPNRAGSDLAFVLALIHVWLRDGKYNKEFVQKYTNGTDELKKAVATTSPQWQEGITGIKSSYVELIANELYSASPKCIIDWGHKSTTTKAEYQRTRAILIANILMGNIEREGGVYFVKNPKRVNELANEQIVPQVKRAFDSVHVQESRIDKAGESGEYKFVSKDHGVLMQIYESIKSKQPYEIRAWFITRHNPLMTQSYSNQLQEAMMELDFIVVNDIYMSKTASMADVILPECTYLERDETIAQNHQSSPSFTLRNKALNPLDANKSFLDTMRILSKKVKLDIFQDSIKTIHLKQCNGDEKLLEELYLRGVAKFNIPPLFALEKIHVDRFTKRYKNAKVDKDGLFSSVLKNLKTQSGKIEINCVHVENEFKGYGVPRACDMSISVTHPYVLMSGKNAIHTNAHTQFVPHLKMLMSTNLIWMSTKTAKKYRLKSGDEFFLENEVAKVKARAFVTEGIRDDTLFAYMGFDEKSGTNLCALLSNQTAPISANMITNVGVSIKRV